jgi:hypothetical protein
MGLFSFNIRGFNSSVNDPFQNIISVGKNNIMYQLVFPNSSVINNTSLSNSSKIISTTVEYQSMVNIGYPFVIDLNNLITVFAFLCVFFFVLGIHSKYLRLSIEEKYSKLRQEEGEKYNVDYSIKLKQKPCVVLKTVIDQFSGFYLPTFMIAEENIHFALDRKNNTVALIVIILILIIRIHL